MRSKLSSRVLSVLLALVLVLSTLSTMAFAAGEKSDDVVILYTNDVHCGVDAGTPEDTMGYANLAAYKHAMEEAHEHVVLVDAGDAHFVKQRVVEFSGCDILIADREYDVLAAD